jgi:hypothetical protein
MSRNVLLAAALSGAFLTASVLALADEVECGVVGDTKTLSKGASAHAMFHVGTGSEAEWAAMVLLTGDSCAPCEIEKACVPFPGWTPLSSIQHYSVPVPNTSPPEHHGHAAVLKDSNIWLTCSKCAPPE